MGEEKCVQKMAVHQMKEEVDFVSVMEVENDV